MTSRDSGFNWIDARSHRRALSKRSDAAGAKARGSPVLDDLAPVLVHGDGYDGVILPREGQPERSPTVAEVTALESRLPDFRTRGRPSRIPEASRPISRRVCAATNGNTSVVRTVHTTSSRRFFSATHSTSRVPTGTMSWS